jgi:hypothetical protein
MLGNPVNFWLIRPSINQSLPFSSVLCRSFFFLWLLLCINPASYYLFSTYKSVMNVVFDLVC